MNVLLELEDIRENLNPELSKSSYSYFNSVVQEEYERGLLDEILQEERLFNQLKSL
jgi:hypothetical protein